MTEQYTFPDLPIEPIRAGRSVLVTGQGRGASTLARRLALELDPDSEGALLLTTNTSGRALATDIAANYPELPMDHLGIIDATGRADTTTDTAARIESVSTPSDLTGISIKFSVLSTALKTAGIDRVRACFDSLSLLALYTELRTVVRFTHALGGRVAATDGLGVFVLDPSMHNPQVEYTLKSVCDGAIEIRREAGTDQVRIEGLSGQPSGWQSIDL